MRFDGRAVRTGAVGALGIALPAALLGQLPDEDSPLLLAVFGVILFGCSAGGYVAGTLRPDTPLIHGALASLAAYGVIQAIGLLLLIVRGDDIPIVVLVFNALLAASVGVLGGLVANRRGARSAP